jgi:serine protease Do
MGFYDDFDKQPKQKRRGAMTSWVAVVLVSAVIGSGTTVALVPTLLKSGALQASGTNIALTSNSSSKVSGLTQTTSVNVNDGIVQAVNKVKPAIVGVLNMQKQKSSFGSFGSSSSSSVQEAGTGSGIVIDDQGHVVTNNHVVEGADEVDLALQDGSHVKAQVVGTDPITDLAVVKVDPSKLKGITPATFGDSSSLNIGETAIAIGNPLGMSFAQTVTVGVISATNRDLPVQDEQSGQTLYSQTVLQTDAAINPGNSGGALCNISGQVIGINSAKIASSGVEGIGFAIPINEARPIIQQILDHGKVVRPQLGISGYNLADVPTDFQANVPTKTGILVEQAQGGAAQAGITKGDVIVKVDGQSVEDQASLRKVLFKHQPGDSVKVEFYRGSTLKTANVKLTTN